MINFIPGSWTRPALKCKMALIQRKAHGDCAPSLK